MNPLCFVRRWYRRLWDYPRHWESGWRKEDMTDYYWSGQP